MLELTIENALDYLREKGWIEPGPARVESLGWGVSNAVLRVFKPEKTFVLKQSRPQLRTKDAWFSDLDRVYREQEVMQFLRPLLPPLTVPEVLFVDRPNHVFAMSHAPVPHQVWKESLLAGVVDNAVSERAGRILGRIHQATASSRARMEAFRDHTVFVQLRVEPFYRRIQERHPDLALRIEPIIDRLLSTKEALCHADYSPKNILVHAEGFTLVDYETAHFGDPSMDLGFLLSHLLLKAVKRQRDRHGFFELTRAFWRGYGEESRYQPLADMQTRCSEHLAVCLLARIDGTSPVDYLPEEPKRETVLQLARRILQDRIGTWNSIVLACKEECRSLS